MSSAYGQQCPVVNNPNQEFCYLDTVGDLEATPAAGKTLRFYRTSTSTNPIPNNEILRSGTYFAGNQDGSCTSRPQINVTVDDLGAPVSTFGNFFEPCVYSTGSVTTVGDLKDLITPADPSFDLNVYANEFGKANDELSDATALIAGENYFIGQDDPSDADCRFSSRIAIEFNPVNAFAPNAAANQIFCESDDPRVRDLEASATSPDTQAFRWYSTRTSQPPLANSTRLIDGETYYVSQIVNRTNSTQPPCESTNRRAVTVTIIPSDAGPDNLDESTCEANADDAFSSTENLKTLFLGLLENNFDSDTDNDVPTNGTFSDSSLSELVAAYTGPGTYSTTYSVEFTEDCTDEVNLAITVVENPDAGDNTELTYCQSDLAALITQIATNPSAAEDAFADLIAGADAGGTFSPELGTIATQYLNDVATNNFPASYSVTYTVTTGTTDDSDCSDSSTLTVNVLADPDAGTDATASFCETDDDVMTAFASQASLQTFILNLLGTDDDSGSFSPSIATLFSNYNNGVVGAEDFSTTYTIAATVACDAVSSTATITINEAVDAEAGTIADVDGVCSNDDVITLSNLLGPDSIAGGTFSSDDTTISNGIFDPSVAGAGDFTITYTIDEDDTCVTGSDSVDFTISVEQAPNAGPGGDFVFCQAEFTALAAQIAANPSGQGEELLNEFDPTIARGGTFTDNNLGELLAQYAATTSFPATFTTTYTVSSGTCTSSADYSITINPNETADAGEDTMVTFCSTEGVVDLNTALSGSTTAGGTFSSDDLTLSGSTFDTGISGAGTFTATYTVDATTDVCITGSDSSTITVVVVQGFDLGEDVTTIVCENDVDAAFFTEANLTSEFNNLLPEDAPNGSFNPSISELAEMYTEGMTTGDFTTTYSIGTNECADSVELTITVRENIDAELDEVANPAPICQNSGVQDLTSFLGDNPDFGVFEGYEDGTFDPSMMAAGDYSITYTLSEDSSDCVSGTDSISFTITVIDSALAGDDVAVTVCQNDGVQNLFDILDGEFTDNDGTFTIDGSVITDGLMDPADFMAGTYMITYTVDAENDCGNDTAMISVTVNESPDAGDDMAVAICQNDDVVDLFSLLSDNTDSTGSFSLNGDVIADGLMNPADFDAGNYAVIYTLENENCTDAATFTITVQDAAFAGMDMEIAVCQNDGVQNLFDFLSVDADTDGEFTLEDGTVVTDGMMDPSTFDAGTYTVTYTVAAINDCGDDTAEFTITVQEVGDAPVVGDATYCAILDPTGADLTAGSEDLTFYTDADLTMMVAEDAPLTEGTYYVTQRGEAGCESEATAFNVSITDPGTPTIDDANQTFCQFDDPTIADLNDAIDQTSNVTWYASADSTDPLSTGTALQDGVTYFASLYDPASDCDSSQRLAVNVSLECDFFIPEGISPNGDQLNDDFEIRYIEDFYPNYTIEIYNRWGDSVYKGNANTPNWDGTSNQGSFGDGLLPVGVYFYYLDFKDGSTEPRRGKVYLSR
ncbi:gliding motility-associated C-terminal domain-containing protein [Christiangramia marina]|uniref:T9SS type B sorting domain-containing protein n=1 Tax=Christiangramia marina TaxID=409436 RepID=UPI003AA8A0FD